MGRLKRIEQQDNVRVVQPPLDVDFLSTGRERRVIVETANSNKGMESPEPSTALGTSLGHG